MLKRSGALRAPKTSAIARRERKVFVGRKTAFRRPACKKSTRKGVPNAFTGRSFTAAGSGSLCAAFRGRAAPMRAQKELSRGRLRHLLHGKRAFFLLHFADIAPPVGILSPDRFNDEVAKQVGKDQAPLCGKTFGSKLRLEGQPAADNARLIAALMGTSFVKDKHSLHLLVQIKPNSQRLSAHPVREFSDAAVKPVETNCYFGLDRIAMHTVRGSKPVRAKCAERNRSFAEARDRHEPAKLEPSSKNDDASEILRHSPQLSHDFCTEEVLNLTIL